MKTQDPYIKQLKDFLKMMQSRLQHAWDEQDDGNDAPMEKLYNQSFTLSFMGKKCELYFGAFEYQEIEQLLQNVIDESTL
jgi:hypothetical protein